MCLFLSIQNDRVITMHNVFRTISLMLRHRVIFMLKTRRKQCQRMMSRLEAAGLLLNLHRNV